VHSQSDKRVDKENRNTGVLRSAIMSRRKKEKGREEQERVGGPGCGPQFLEEVGTVVKRNQVLQVIRQNGDRGLKSIKESKGEHLRKRGRKKNQESG